MTPWQPTLEQQQQFEDEGYFILRGVIPRDSAIELRGVIKNTILMPEPDTKADVDPMDPMGNSVAARAARFRKLSNFCAQSPLIWHKVHAGAGMPAVARYFLGDDILLKFNSCFLKPARTGSETPWHQDNGLWRDGESAPFNFWMALDPATRSNGCMQFIPGSHTSEIVPHVLYPDSIHGELPRDRVRDMIDRHGVRHIELDSGDVVCWHSNLWHYSPPNTSDQGRIAVAGVYTTPRISTKRYWIDFLWVLKNGRRSEQFPPEVCPVPQSPPPPPYPKVEAETIAPGVDQSKVTLESGPAG